MNINWINDAHKTTEAFNMKARMEPAPDSGFKDSLLKNMDMQTAQETLGPGTVKTKNRTDENDITDNFYQLGKPPVEKPCAAQEVGVRHLPYQQCDQVRINVLEGYVLKAKLEKNGEGAYPFVYVEAKYDDGRTNAYQVEVGKIPEGTRDPVEKIAAETV